LNFVHKSQPHHRIPKLNFVYLQIGGAPTGGGEIGDERREAVAEEEEDRLESAGAEAAGQGVSESIVSTQACALEVIDKSNYQIVSQLDCLCCYAMTYIASL
jgi:hypothetical protein